MFFFKFKKSSQKDTEITIKCDFNQIISIFFGTSALEILKQLFIS